jgi:hypothetical protein
LSDVFSGVHVIPPPPFHLLSLWWNPIGKTISENKKGQNKKERWRNHPHSRTDTRQGKPRARKKMKGGGATTCTPEKTRALQRRHQTRKAKSKKEEQERRARRAVEEPLALQDRHQNKKGKRSTGRISRTRVLP